MYAFAGARASSDHSPLLITCAESATTVSQPRPFRFQSMWIGHPDLETLVMNSWDEHLVCGNGINRVCVKLRRIKGVLKDWNISVFGLLKVQIKEKYDKLVEIQTRLASGAGGVTRVEEFETRREYNSILSRESAFYRQKNRASWLKDGDRNTSFFHKSTKVRDFATGVNFLEVDGEITDDREVFSARIGNYYKDLFSFSPVASNLPFLQDILGSEITHYQNDFLTNIPSVEEIKTAVFSLSVDSAPEPDGFSGHFYHRFWDIIHNDVQNAVIWFFTRGRLPKGLNASFVTLIPKMVDAKKVEDFRPIVLCNYIYKVIAKIFASRFGVILAKVVSFNQFGFIPGRNIHDCVAMASEGINGLDNPAKLMNIAIKVDIRKAYDTLSWSFLLDVLQAWGFSQVFVNLIREILGSGHLSILINGSPVGYFGCKRGVRQGDALFPLLFCVVEEVLSRLLNRAMEDRRLEAFRLGRAVEFPSHLLYADDIIVFCKATISNAKCVFRILSDYADLSGQSFNPSKSRVYFSSSIDTGLKGLIFRELGILASDLPFTYLGVTLLRGVPRVRHLRGIADAVIVKQGRWKGRTLSLAGRVCLVESVIKGAFVHSMMVYMWPKELIRMLDMSMRNFIWTGDIGRRGSVPVNWARCCRPKCEGGLGIKSMEVMNEALVAKFTWRILTSQDKIARLLHSSAFFKGQAS